MTFFLEYSNTGKQYRKFGTAEASSVDELLRWLFNFHTAEFYKIDGKVYRINRINQSYTRQRGK